MSRGTTRITRRAYTVLAALMLADGTWVPAASLASGLFAQPMTVQALRKHIWHLQAFGVPQVVRCWRNGYSRGYRLARLPADEHLEPMLACVPVVKRSAWWQTRRSQTHMTA